MGYGRPYPRLLAWGDQKPQEGPNAVSASLGSFWRRWRNWIIGAVVALVVLFVGGPFVYINFIKEDAPTA